NAEPAPGGAPAQCRRPDVQHHVLVFADGDLVPSDRHLAVRPGGRVGPVHLPGCRLRPAFLGTQNREYADNQGCWQQRENQERAIPSAHDVTPPIQALSLSKAVVVALPIPDRPTTRPRRHHPARRRYPIRMVFRNLSCDTARNSLTKPALTITSGAFCSFAPRRTGRLDHVHRICTLYTWPPSG